MHILTQVIRRLNTVALPEAIYHYTSPEALTGIVRDKQLWATNIRYLNDSQEFVYTRS